MSNSSSAPDSAPPATWSSGKGKAIGPDLSNVGREMTAPEIQSALLNPSAHITPGYELVTVKLRDGQTLRGFARNRSDFDIQLQDLEGRFHLLRPGQIASVQNEKQSPMPPLKAGPEQLRDLVAYLGHLTGVKPGTVAPPGESGGVTFSRILNTESGEWLTYNGNISGNRYSELNSTNHLERKSTRSQVDLLDPSLRSRSHSAGRRRSDVLHRSQPVLRDRCRDRPADLALRASHDSRTRSATPPSAPTKAWPFWATKFSRSPTTPISSRLNRTTGQLVWEAVMPEEPMHYGSTVAPLVVKDLVIAGVSGGDRGIRGFLAAYKASTGERVWRHWTVPRRAANCWAERPGCTGSYDPESDTLFWATGNPYPDSDDRNRPGDNLYTNCVLALDPATGDLKWHYQFTPHDIHDWDATEPNVLVDTKFKGQDRKLLLHADRNGFFYVLDRTNGKVLLADKFVKRLTWASGIGPDGRPQMLPAPTFFVPRAKRPTTTRPPSVPRLISTT